MRKHYIALVHKDEDSRFGVSFPDFPGVVTAAPILNEALERAEEALALHVEGMAEDGEPIPPPPASPRSSGTTPTPCRCSFRFRSQGPCSPSEEGDDEPRPIVLQCDRREITYPRPAHKDRNWRARQWEFS
jgi:predicted RNase H-like HicB family nuclease